MDRYSPLWWIISALVVAVAIVAAAVGAWLAGEMSRRHETANIWAGTLTFLVCAAFLLIVPAIWFSI